MAAAAGGTLAGQAAAAGSPPGAPTLVSASASGTSVTLTWTNGTGAQGANSYQNGVKHWVGGSPNPVPTTYTYTGLANGTYTYQVADYNGAGQGPLSNSLTATVGGTPPPTPTVTSLSVTSGDENGGTALTVNGTNFTGATAVDFGAVAATSFTVTGPGTISATSPAATNTGPVDVTVTTPGGKSAVNQPGDEFTYTTPPAPTVSLVNPTTGPSGTSVTVSGTDFTGATTVDFGTGNPATFTVNSNTTIQATVPSGTGTVDVTVTTNSGTSAINSNDQFAYGAGTPPTVIPSPVTGPGWQLNGTATVITTASPPNLQLTPVATYQAGSAFYTTPVPGVGISAAFDAQIHGGTGADGLCLVLADASVTKPTALGVNGGGEGFSGIKGIALSLDTYKNSVNPSNNFVGIATGAGPYSASLHYVTTNSSIPALRTGTHHFVLTTFSSGLSVTMDGNPVLNYATTLPTNVLVGFTAGEGGLTDIHAVQNVSITAGPPPPAPVVTGVSPTSGPSTGGTPVTITGSGFTGASQVLFGGLAVSSYTVVNDGEITTTSPPESPATVDVTVTAAGGDSATNANDKFTYNPPPQPTVTGLNPTSGPSGTSVTVSGTNFTGATAVDFGTGNPATTFNVTNDGSLTATAPTGTGTVDVTVTTSGGTSAVSQPADEFQYTLPPQPTVTGLNPTSGPSGTSVTVSGTNFTGATAVDF
ncbi:MAG TPA: IPT/TIG domain-containing protein, partial [Acidimicrobiales bacterium]|nr:IPT/TIG domain-containing protein [Acidimicrobiales bacterium]